MDKESAALLKVVLVGLAAIILFLLWAGLVESRGPAAAALGQTIQMMAGGLMG
jgi:hypothetical protein